MAALYDASVRAFAADNQSTLETAAFDIGAGGATDLVCWAWIKSGAGTPVDPSSVKVGGSSGTSMTKIGSTINIGSFLKLSLYELIAPPTGSQAIWVDWGANQDERVIIAITYKVAHQTTPKGTVATATGNDGTPTVNVTTVSGEPVVDGVWGIDGSGGNPTLTVGASQTSRQEVDAGDLQYEAAGVSSETAAGTTTTMSWSISGPGPEWGIIAFGVKETAGDPDIDADMDADFGGFEMDATADVASADVDLDATIGGLEMDAAAAIIVAATADSDLAGFSIDALADVEEEEGNSSGFEGDMTIGVDVLAALSADIGGLEMDSTATSIVDIAVDLDFSGFEIEADVAPETDDVDSDLDADFSGFEVDSSVDVIGTATLDNDLLGFDIEASIEALISTALDSDISSFEIDATLNSLVEVTLDSDMNPFIMDSSAGIPGEGFVSVTHLRKHLRRR